MNGEIIGYLWVSRGDGDADVYFTRRLSSEQDTLLAAARWSTRMHRAKADGLTSLEAMRRWIGAEEDPEAGGIAADVQVQEVVSEGRLKELANPGHEDPECAGVVGPSDILRDDGADWGNLSPFTLEKRGYSFLAEGPVRYLTVTRGRRVLGYLWASESDEAAGYIQRMDAGPEGFDAGAVWRERLEQSSGQRLTALTALRRWAGEPEDATRSGGTIPPDAEERTAPSLDALRVLANSPERR